MVSKKQKPRAKRGSVSVWTRSGNLSLRWTHQGKEYYLSLGLRDNPYNRAQAEPVRKAIQTDLDDGDFDPTLERYKARIEKYQPKQAEQEKLGTFDLFALWRKEDGEKCRHRAMLTNLKRFGQDITTEEGAKAFMELLRSRQSAKTANSNLSMLTAFGQWCCDQKYLEINPFANIKGQKTTRKAPPQPFTREEIDRLLTGFKFHAQFSCYHDFVYTLISLGLRPSEAIGLRWGDVNLESAIVTIRESLSRNSDGRSSGSARQRKETKTGSIRVLELNPRLVDILKGRKPIDANPTDLIFTSQRGKPIDDHNFSQRIWKKVCEVSGVAYRTPYNCRHTLISHLIEEGATLTQAAAIAGHANTRMVSEVYGHMVNRPKMPEF